MMPCCFDRFDQLGHLLVGELAARVEALAGLIFASGTMVSVEVMTGSLLPSVVPALGP
jgi:hypothetical protein